jgi:hypothetical protein
LNQKEREQHPILRYFPHLILVVMAIAFVGYGGQCAVRYVTSQPAIAEPPAVSNAEPSR